MIFKELNIPGIFLIKPMPYEDERGEFFRVYCKKEFSLISNSEFVQINQSVNFLKGTLRGLHYQTHPYEEEKIIRCIRGEVFDVFVDLRKNSPTFLKYDYTILSEKNKYLIYLPRGIAHGFITLCDNSQLLYHHSQYYNPNSECGIRYDDPLLGIKWPIIPKVMSLKDKSFPYLKNDFAGI